MRTVICGVAGLLAVVGLSGCDGQLFGGAGGSAAPFEFSLVPGAGTQADVALKVNVGTGQAWVTNGSQIFTPIAEPAAIPAGDYHISSWSTSDANGKFSWDAYRFERKTGKTWYVSCATMPNCTWMAVTP